MMLKEDVCFYTMTFQGHSPFYFFGRFGDVSFAGPLKPCSGKMRSRSLLYLTWSEEVRSIYQYRSLHFPVSSIESHFKSGQGLCINA